MASGESSHCMQSRLWNVDFGSRSRNRRVLVPGPIAVPAESPKKIESPPTSPLEESPLPAPTCSSDIPPLLSVDTATDAGKLLVCSTTIPPLVFEISHFEKSEYRADVLNADHASQAVRLID